MDLDEIFRRHGLLGDGVNGHASDGASSRNGFASATIHPAVQGGQVREEDALRAIAEEVGLAYVDLTTVEPDLSLLKTFPPKLIHRSLIFPIRQEAGTLYVATCDPFDLHPLDEAGEATGRPVVPLLTVRDELAKLIKRHLGVGSETIEGMMEQAEADGDLELLSGMEVDGSELAEMAQEASVIRLVNEILLEAVESRTSDVHIESQARGISIRYRIDGILHAQPVPPEINRFQAAIISRLKIMARLNIAEKRLPQDGRMKLKVRGREIDVRVSVIPMIHGESLVMRILDKGSLEFDIRKLGMGDHVISAFEQLIRLPHGIILVTGPTGSGKTTTLYSALKEINDDETKIITTEDPVEYQLEGINQIQVHHKIGLTFAASLRSILRHDPDVVLVGEIRDLETAENAIQASLTGHLAIGHTRYSTTGASVWENAQPTFRSTAAGSLAVGHNGNLTNTAELADLIEKRRAESGQLPYDSQFAEAEARRWHEDQQPGHAVLHGTTDTEVIAALLASYPDRTLESAAGEVFPQLRGAFSLVFMDEHTLYAARDGHGVRPLVLGRLDRGWVVASETAALDIVGASFVREVEPGELITIDADGLRSERFAVPEPKGSIRRVSGCSAQRRCWPQRWK